MPLLRPALFAAWIFVFLLSLASRRSRRCSTSTSPVIATTMLDLWDNGNINQVSAFGAIVAILSIALAAAAYRVSRRWGLQV